jgi:hypothetical protein
VASLLEGKQSLGHPRVTGFSWLAAAFSEADLPGIGKVLPVPKNCLRALSNRVFLFEKVALFPPQIVLVLRSHE